MTPAIGAYWLQPRENQAPASAVSAGAASKSGNPCERLIAPCSSARCDMTVKMLTPVDGRRGVGRMGGIGLGDGQQDLTAQKPPVPLRGGLDVPLLRPGQRTKRRHRHSE